MSVASALSNPKLEQLGAQIEALQKQATEIASGGVYGHMTLTWPAYGISGLPMRPMPSPPWNPSNPSLSDRQAALKWFHEEFGVFGLWYWVFLIAKTQKELEIKETGRYNTCWDKIIEDWRDRKQKDSRVLFYLSSMHPDVTNSLIDGDLSLRMQDRTFQSRVLGSLGLSTRPGVYVIFVSRAASPNTTAANIGKGLTLAELADVYHNMARYCNTNRTAADIEFCKRVDGNFRQSGCINHNYARGEARYASGNHNYSVIELWLKGLDSFLSQQKVHTRILSNPQDPELHQPLRRSFCYVGLSHSPAGRATQHWAHHGVESIVFGLFTAVVEHLFPGSFGVQHSTYQILRTTARDEIGLGEIICTILCSGSGWDLGLNNDHPGKQVGTRTQQSSAYDNDLAANLTAIQAEGHIDRNLQVSNEKIGKWKSIFSDYEHLQRQHPILEKMVANNKENVDALLARHRTTTLASDMTRLRRAEQKYLASVEEK